MERLDTERNRPAFLSSCWAFQALLFLVWMRPTALSFVITVLKRLPLIGSLGGAVYPATICILMLVALPWFQRSVRWVDVLAYVAMLMVILATLIVPLGNAEYLQEQLERILLSVLPMLFLGLGYRHERDKGVLYWASLIGVAVMFVYQLYQIAAGRELDEDSMDAAYRVLPSVMVLIYNAFIRKKLKYWLPIVIGIYLQFGYGTRGPILCIIVFCAVAILLRLGETKNGIIKILSMIAVIVAVSYILFTDVMQEWAKELSKIFEEQGLSTRIFEFFLEGNITDDSGRSYYTETVWNGLLDHPLFGLGLMGDRVLTGAYVHNIFLELLSNFGFLLGTGLILVVLFIPLRALVRSSRDSSLRMFVIMMITMNFVKLCLSSSYLHETQFFFMIGACLSVARQKTEPRLKEVRND